MKSRTLLTVLATLATAAALTTGCTPGSGTPDQNAAAPSAPTGSATPAVTTGPSPGTPDPAQPSATATPSGPDETASPAGPDNAAPARNCPADDNLGNGLLSDVRTGHHPTFDRVVFEFCGTAAVSIRWLGYVDEVRHDASGQPVPLAGHAFVRVAMNATTDTARYATDPQNAPRYTGPTRVSPNGALLKEVALAGDFEGVLSFGIGIDHPTGVHVLKLASPPRVVIDFWSAVPPTLIWPASSLAQARELQNAADQGHQPWLLPGSPQSTTLNYAQQVLGWADAVAYRIADTVYQVSRPGTNDTAIVALVQPVRQGSGGLWVVADVARSDVAR